MEIIHKDHEFAISKVITVKREKLVQKDIEFQAGFPECKTSIEIYSMEYMTVRSKKYRTLDDPWWGVKD